MAAPDDRCGGGLLRIFRAAGLLSCLALATLVSLLASGCGTGGGESKRWTLANVHVTGYPTARGLEDFARFASEDPDLAGRLAVDLQLGGVLGNEKETLEKLGFGGIQLACTSAAPLAEFAEAVGVLSLPYLFRDGAHMWAVLDGEVGEELSAALAEAGFVPLAWYDAGARSFYNRKRPVRRLEDLVGLKIRVQRSEVMRDMVEALGASPVALGFKQVYTSLHTGAVDGAENNLPSYRSERHFEAARFYSRDRHSMIPDVVLAGKAAWDSLSAEEKAAFRSSAVRSAEAQRRYWLEYSTAAESELAEAGVEIADVEDMEAFRRAVSPVYEKHAGRYGDLVERIRAEAGGAATAGPLSP